MFRATCLTMFWRRCGILCCLSNKYSRDWKRLQLRTRKNYWNIFVASWRRQQPYWGIIRQLRPRPLALKSRTRTRSRIWRSLMPHSPPLFNMRTHQSMVHMGLVKFLIIPQYCLKLATSSLNTLELLQTVLFWRQKVLKAQLIFCAKFNWTQSFNWNFYDLRVMRTKY